MIKKASILICTCNRDRLLRQALESLKSLKVPEDIDLEVVVIDNNSTDNTRTVVEEFRKCLPVRYVFENRPGKTNACNRALQEASGDILFWTDDDVVVPPNWIHAMLQCHQQFQAEIVYGKVVPRWESKPPAWFTPAFNGRFALLDHGPVSRLTSHEVGFGVNYSVFSDTMKRIGMFRTDLGPRQIGDGKPQSNKMTAGGGEDTDLFERAYSLGIPVAYCATESMQHVIPQARCEKNFYRSRSWYASEQYYLRISETPDIPKLFGVPRFLHRRALGELFHYLKAILTFQKGEAFLYELRLIEYVGIMNIAWKRYRRPSR